MEYPSGDDTPRSHLPFSPAAVAGGLVFVSGQASVDATGKLVPGDFESEFRLSLENLEKILKTAGSDFAHVVQTRNYVRDPANVPLFNRLYREYFSAPYPARTTITNCLPPTMHFEIECVAMRK
ncbi:endoribonuclease L-PSP [Opitutaceae bacterium TAV5]|nr:endoribonuclease L-PSP [Opitutaceae bacterium TAV5]